MVGRNSNSNNNNSRNNSSRNDKNNNDLLPDRATANSRLPLSGTENAYSPLTYGSRRGKGGNNCYAYAMDLYRNGGHDKLQPGEISHSPGELDLGSCASLRARALADMAGRAYAAAADKPCRRGEYKAMAFLAEGNDYHWYRQHKDALVRLTSKVRDAAGVARALGVRADQVVMPRGSRIGDFALVKNAGVWSHKQGLATGPLLKDACGKSITDPRKACRRYGADLDYRTYCGSFCVKKRGS